MNNNKFIKFLIILNGLMLPVLLGFAIFQISKEFFPRNQPIQQKRDLIVGEELEEAKKDSIAWQGLEYEIAENKHRGKGFYVKVGVKDYVEGKKYSKLVSNYSGGNYYEHTSDINVIFLDENYNVIRSLLDKRASVSHVSLDYSHVNNKNKDEKHTVIIYKIGFEDTNKDGKLNYLDKHDLYFSGLLGENLTQITEDINIVDWTVDYKKETVFISYTENSDEREEHKDVKFKIYSIKTKKMKELGQLNDELKKLEKIIRE